MAKISGSCHCGNITFHAELKNSLLEYLPRACSCKLCRSHGAAYISDHEGSIAISIKNENDLSRYRQGSKLADFLICKNCGVMTNVIYEESGKLYASINARATDQFEEFGDPQRMQLAELTDEERVNRWKDIWFSDVNIEIEKPSAS